MSILSKSFKLKSLSKLLEATKKSQKRVIKKRASAIKDSEHFLKLTGKAAYGTKIERSIINYNALNAKRNLQVRDIKSKITGIKSEIKKSSRHKVKFIRRHGRIIPIKVRG